MEPKLMTSLSGEQITNVTDWEKIRREELRYLLEHYAYGHRPVETPDKVSFTVAEEKEVAGLQFKKVLIDADGFVLPIRMFIPKADKPVPCFVYFMHNAQQTSTDIEKEPNTLYIPIADIGKRGYAVAVIYFNDIYPDHKNLRTYDCGIFSHFGPFGDKRKDSDWAAIAAWAWGASRAADYLVTDPQIDPKNLAVAGHSRGGKAALWTGATDERFRLTISNSSGCMGAAMLRGKTGEHIDFISTHTDWLCRKQWSYADCEEMFPVDQHMLLALIAPRLLYVQSSILDDWSDPSAERRSCKLAGEAYALYGKDGLIISEEIENDFGYHEGNIGYHVSTGEHKIRSNDWEMFMNFWDKHRK